MGGMGRGLSQLDGGVVLVTFCHVSCEVHKAWSYKRTGSGAAVLADCSSPSLHRGKLERGVVDLLPYV